MRRFQEGSQIGSKISYFYYGDNGSFVLGSIYVLYDIYQFEYAVSSFYSQERDKINLIVLSYPFKGIVTPYFQIFP